MDDIKLTPYVGGAVHMLKVLQNEHNFISLTILGDTLGIRIGYSFTPSAPTDNTKHHIDQSMADKRANIIIVCSLLKIHLQFGSKSGTLLRRLFYKLLHIWLLIPPISDDFPVAYRHWTDGLGPLGPCNQTMVVKYFIKSKKWCSKLAIFGTEDVIA